MPEPKTYFEQIPLEAVEKIIKKQTKPGKTTEQLRTIKNNK
jgi:hypothetical protein